MLIQVINGTTREGRFSERIAHWVLDFARQYEGVEFELVDLRDHPLPFFDGAAPMWTPRQYTDEAVARFGRTVDRADGYIFLTAEYNHGYSAVLKNALDWTYAEWHRKPAGFVGWGGVGGARAVEQLRQVTVEFEMAPLRHAVHIAPEIYLPARDQADPTDTAVFAPAEPFLKLLADDLLWWADALRTARTRDAS